MVSKTWRLITIRGWSTVCTLALLLFSSTWKCQWQGLATQAHMSSLHAHPAPDSPVALPQEITPVHVSKAAPSPFSIPFVVSEHLAITPQPELPARQGPDSVCPAAGEARTMVAYAALALPSFGKGSAWDITSLCFPEPPARRSLWNLF